MTQRPTPAQLRMRKLIFALVALGLTIATAAVAWEAGFSAREAARQAGTNRKTSATYFRLWANDPSILDPIRRQEKRRASSELFVHIAPELKMSLEEQANRRKISLNMFVGFILEVLIEDGLIPAVLDEDESKPKELLPQRRNCRCGATFFAIREYGRLCRDCARVQQWGPREGEDARIAAQAAGIDARHDLTRNEKMIAKRVAGMTLEAIGQQHGITRERVRQLTDPEWATAAQRQKGTNSIAARLEVLENKKASLLGQATVRLMVAWDSAPPDVQDHFLKQISATRVAGNGHG